ncbi:hypothetical protein MHBO_003427 [Bonamia ostreae]|uniref:Copper transport protein n=1 Tax=Bonamia ostreae TaxID=126728 RepID=A0ABV2AQI6_9EUKA
MKNGGMQMTFNADVNVTILFKVWKTKNWWQLLLSALIIIILGLVKEAISFFRKEKIRKKLVFILKN